VLLGTQAAHALAYDLVYRQVHARILLETGHGYLTWLPLALALAGVVALAALGVAAADAARGRPALPAWAFAVLAPAMFVIQEVLELSLHTGGFNAHALLAPTFLPNVRGPPRRRTPLRYTRTAPPKVSKCAGVRRLPHTPKTLPSVVRPVK
jgi:hypothetical protein